MDRNKALKPPGLAPSAVVVVVAVVLVLVLVYREVLQRVLTTLV